MITRCQAGLIYVSESTFSDSARIYLIILMCYMYISVSFISLFSYFAGCNLFVVVLLYRNFKFDALKM